MPTLKLGPDGSEGIEREGAERERLGPEMSEAVFTTPWAAGVIGKKLMAMVM